MKMKLLRPFVALLAGMMLMSGAALAQDDASIMDRLNLSDAQKGQVKDLREKFRVETEKLRADIKRLLDQERALKKGGGSTDALRPVLKQRADKEVELSLALTRFNEQLEGILTQDQRRVLEKIREEKRRQK